MLGMSIVEEGVHGVLRHGKMDMECGAAEVAGVMAEAAGWVVVGEREGGLDHHYRRGIGDEGSGHRDTGGQVEEGGEGSKALVYCAFGVNHDDDNGSMG